MHHKDCLINWISSKSYCPSCNTGYAIPEVITVLANFKNATETQQWERRVESMSIENAELKQSLIEQSNKITELRSIRPATSNVRSLQELNTQLYADVVKFRQLFEDERKRREIEGSVTFRLMSQWHADIQNTIRCVEGNAMKANAAAVHFQHQLQLLVQQRPPPPQNDAQQPPPPPQSPTATPNPVLIMNPSPPAPSFVAPDYNPAAPADSARVEPGRPSWILERYKYQN